MARYAFVALALLQAVGSPARAAEFAPSWFTDSVWTSNVLRANTNEQSDISLRTGPTLRVREKQGGLNYDISYQGLYQAYARTGGLNAFDQNASLQGAWEIASNTKLEASDNFAYVNGVNALLDTTGNVAFVTPQTTKILLNTSNLSLTHRLGPLWQLSASAGNQLYEYKNATQANTTATTGTLQITRRLSRRLTAGVGAQYQRQEFAALATLPSSGTSFYQGFGVLNYEISRTWRISAQAGPAWAQPDATSVQNVSLPSYLTVDPLTCPQDAAGRSLFFQFPQSAAELCSQAAFRSLANGAVVGLPQASNTSVDVPFVGQQSAAGSLNYFGSVNLEKDWRLWHLKLGYSRSASNGSGLNTSTTVDQFSASASWTPTRLWRLELAGIYATQTAVSSGRQRVVTLATRRVIQNIGGQPAVIFLGVPLAVGDGDVIANSVDIKSYSVALTVRRQISRRVTIDGGAKFWEQSTGGLLSSTQTRVLSVNLGFTWTFDPIPL